MVPALLASSDDLIGKIAKELPSSVLSSNPFDIGSLVLCDTQPFRAHHSSAAGQEYTQARLPYLSLNWSFMFALSGIWIDGDLYSTFELTSRIGQN